MSLPDWMNTLKATVLPKPPGGGVRLKGLGVVLGLVIAAVAIFVLSHTLKHIDFDEVLAVVRRTHPGADRAGRDAGGDFISQSDAV
ncbi:MAG: hypothetical protein WDN50_11475 [Bradyrhizobium sp.]